ncbi:MAG: ABC transporter permease [Bacteroidales bacterium]
MIAFIIKEFRHILRDPRSLLILIGMPVAQIMIFGYAITTDLKESNIGIVRKTNDPLSTLLVHHLDASQWFRVVKVWENPGEIENTFRKGDIRMAIVLDDNPEAHLMRGEQIQIQLIGDASDPNTANLLVQYAKGIVATTTARYVPDNQAPQALQVSTRMLYNEEIRSVFMFVPGTIVIILMLLSAIMTSISLTREKETGSMEVLLVSPLQPHEIILGKVIPYVGLSLLNAVTILILAKLLFGMPFRGSLALLMAETVLFIGLALSIGIFISTVTRTQQMALLLSMFALMLPTILLSGFIFPVENMPQWLQYFSAFMPARWFVNIVRGIMIRGVGIEFIWKETLILAAMTLFFIALSIKKFKIRLE